MITAQAGAASLRFEAPDDAVPIWRLNALRAGYLLLAVGMGAQVWPAILLRADGWELMEGVVQCMLGAMSLLALLGLRRPLRMLPLLFWEITWKATWLLAVAAPRWAGGGMDADTTSVAFACLVAVVFPVLIPWRHVARTYFGGPAERWR